VTRIVITGAPGSGKTTLLLALQALGHTIVGDSARVIIQDRRSRGLSPRPSPSEFAQETLRVDIENYVLHAETPGYVFFERGVVDALCGVDLTTPLNKSELNAWLAEYPYGSTAFLLPAWKDIYVADAERDHSFEHAQWVDGITRDWYRRCGYQLVEVPRAPVPERCRFVLETLAQERATIPRP
jgi:predicted ATPase